MSTATAKICKFSADYPIIEFMSGDLYRGLLLADVITDTSVIVTG